MNEQIGEKQIEALIGEAKRLKKQNNISLALHKALESSDLDSNNLEMLLLIATCNFNLGEFQLARVYWDKVLNLSPGHREAQTQISNFKSPSFQNWVKRYFLAVKEIENRKYEQAKNILQKLLQENDSIISVYEMLGFCYMALRDKHNAKLIWHKGLDLDISNSKLIECISSLEEKNIVVRQKQISKDSKVLNTIILNKSKYLAWGVGLVFMFTLAIQGALWINDRDNKKNIIEELEKEGNLLASKLDKEEAIISNVILSKDLSSFDSIEKNDSFEEENLEKQDLNVNNKIEGSEYDTKLEEHYYFTGYKFYLEKNYNAAINNLRVVVDMATGTYINREALYYLARSYYLDKKLDAAEENYINYLDQFPDTNYIDDSLFFLGCVYLDSGREEEARHVFLRLQEETPTSGYLSNSKYIKAMSK